jgi:hypothetical protein
MLRLIVALIVVASLGQLAAAGDPPLTDVLRKLPHAQKVDAKIAHAEPQTRIIHVLDWHMLSAQAFVADENDRAGKALDADELEKRYAKHLDDVEKVHKEQVDLLTAIIAKLEVSAVLQEGLTPESVKSYRLLAKVLAEKERRLGDALKFREAILQQGATGQLFRAGRIKEVLPLDDAAAWKAANPVKEDGSVLLDEKAIKKREEAQVAAILRQRGIVVIVLGGAHDLTDALEHAGKNVEYLRVSERSYTKLAMP